MSDVPTTNAPGKIDPERLYTEDELSALVGLSARRIKRMLDDGRMDFIRTGETRGRVIEGQQYLDWLDRNRRSARRAS